MARNTSSAFHVKGIDGVKKLVVGLHEQFDISAQIEDLVAEGDRVVARIACSITHKKNFMGVAPTGRKFVVKGVEIFRVVNGKLAERWIYMDMAPMMKELGVLAPR